MSDESLTLNKLIAPVLVMTLSAILLGLIANGIILWRDEAAESVKTTQLEQRITRMENLLEKIRYECNLQRGTS